MNQRHMSQLENLESLLASAAGIQSLGLSEEADLDSPIEFWKLFANVDLSPTSSVDFETEVDELRDWFEEIVGELVSNKQCCISVGGMGDLPWCKVSLESAFDLFKFWQSLTNKEFLLLNPLQRRVVGILEDEYSYDYFLREKF